MSDASAIEENDQCVKYASEVKQIISYILSSRILTRGELANATGIKEHTIGVFLSRENESPRYSLTLSRLYHFLISEFDRDSVAKDMETYANLAKILNSRKTIESYAHILFGGLINYIGSSLQTIEKTCQKYNGRFYIYRKSILTGRVVKSQLDIVPDDNINSMWRCVQKHKDSLGNIRKSNGIVSVNVGNIYCMGKMEVGLGLDIIVFKSPVISEQNVTQALVMTLDNNLQPIVAKAVLRRSQNQHEEEFGAFSLADISNEMGEFVRFIDPGTATFLETT